MNEPKDLGFLGGIVASIVISIAFGFLVFFSSGGWQPESLTMYTIVLGLMILGVWRVYFRGAAILNSRLDGNQKRHKNFVMGFSLGIISIALLVFFIFK